MSNQFYPIPNYENYYEINKLGEVKNKKTGRVLKQHPDSRGYLRVNFYINKKIIGKTVHQLLALSFLGFPPGAIGQKKGNYQVNHKDTIKTNNNLENLEWVTVEENIKHAKENNIWKKANKKGEQHSCSKLTNEQVYNIRVRASKGESCKSIADSLSMNTSHIRRIIRGDIWTDAPGPITKDHLHGFLFEITDPKGNTYKTTNLKGFSRKHNLESSGMVSVSIGRTTNYYGWKVKKFKDGKLVTPKIILKKKFNFRIISPQQVEVVTSNLKEFCRQYSELSYKTLTNKAWEYKEYKGWKFYKEEFIY